ncbi:MAG: hypothetical protein RIT25_1182 [Planctomycetota bacterium]
MHARVAALLPLLAAIPWLAAQAPATAPKPVAPKTATAPAATAPATDAPMELGFPAAWSTAEVGEGVVLHRRIFEALEDRPQAVAVLVVEAQRAEVTLELAIPGKLRRTSAVATERGALAAVNGGFYLADTSPRGRRRLAGKEVVAGSGGSIATVGWAREGAVSFGGSQDAFAGCDDVMEAGPMVLVRSKVRPGGEKQRTVRHPRTVLGTRKDGTLVLAAVDGRNARAAGMTFSDLGRLMLALGCTDAINLDGGGSTTMWTRAEGVVNHPCDDKVFDAAGERAVADAVLVHAPAVVVLDDELAHVAPEGAFARVTARAALGGSHLLAKDGRAAEVTWTTAVPRPGRYAVFTRDLGSAAGGLAWNVPPARAGPAAPEGWKLVGAVEVAEGKLLTVRASGSAGARMAVDALRLREL